MSHSVFISYSSRDVDVALSLCESLERDASLRCWIAPRDIPAGSDYPTQILAAIDSSHALVLVFSSGADASPHVLREVNRAAEKKLRIIPFRVEAVESSGGLTYFVALPQWIDATTPPVEQHFPKVVDALRGPLGLPAVAIPASAPAKTPKFHLNLALQLRWLKVAVVISLSLLAIAIPTALLLPPHLITTGGTKPTQGGLAFKGRDLRPGTQGNSDLKEYLASHGNSLRDADLSGSNLDGMDLSGVDLTDAILRDASLRGARLNAGQLLSADIRGADLGRVPLSEPDRTRALLAGAKVDPIPGPDDSIPPDLVPPVLPSNEEIVHVERKRDLPVDAAVPHLPLMQASANESPRVHTLSIGISNYEDFPALPFAAHDAKEIAAVLRDKNQKAGLSSETAVLTNGEATRDAILGKIDGMPVRPGDTVVVYFSGYGRVDDGQLDLLSASDRKGERGGLPLLDIRRRMEGRGVKIVVFIDVKPSPDSDSSTNPSSIAAILERLASPSFAAIGGGYPSKPPSKAGEPGLFTKYLIEGLEGKGNVDDDHAVTFAEIARFLEKGISPGEIPIPANAPAPVASPR